MALNFDNEIPEWKNEGVEPSEELREKGFTGGYKPPATVFNWFWSKVQKCIAELQNKLKGHDEKLSSVEGDYLSKSKGGTVKGEVEFQKNVCVRKSHILGSEGGQTADIDFGYAGSLCLGLRDGNSTTSEWKSYIEFGQASGGLRSYSSSGNFNTVTGSYGLITTSQDSTSSDGDIVIAAGHNDNNIKYPGQLYDVLADSLHDISAYEDIDWDDLKQRLSGFGDVKILSSGDIVLISRGDNLNLISKYDISLQSGSFQTRAVGGKCTDGNSDYYEEINSDKYKSYHTKEQRFLTDGDILLIPGHHGIEGNDTDGKHNVIVSNLKGKTSSSGVKPKITNFSDIHSANFEEGGENLIDKYNRKLFNVYECNENNEVTIPDFVSGTNYGPFILKFKSNSTTGNVLKIKINSNTYDLYDFNSEMEIIDSNIQSGILYVLNYQPHRLEDGENVVLCLGTVSSEGFAKQATGTTYYNSLKFGLLGCSNGHLKINENGYLDHLSGNGHNHIPANGSIGQVLVNNGSGKAKWETLKTQSITVDDELSDTSINPVQNKVIKKALDGVIPYGICQTAGNENSKTVEIPNFKLSDHCWFYLIFTNDNSSGSATLTVNGEGGFDIYYWNDSSFFEDIKANILYLVYLDGADSGTFYLIDTTSALSNFKADNSPVSGSSNLITSGGVYEALNAKYRVYVKSNNTIAPYQSFTDGALVSSLQEAFNIVNADNDVHRYEIVLLPGSHDLPNKISLSKEVADLTIRGFNSVNRDNCIINYTKQGGNNHAALISITVNYDNLSLTLKDLTLNTNDNSARCIELSGCSGLDVDNVFFIGGNSATSLNTQDGIISFKNNGANILRTVNISNCIFDNLNTNSNSYCVSIGVVGEQGNPCFIRLCGNICITEDKDFDYLLPDNLLNSVITDYGNNSIVTL